MVLCMPDHPDGPPAFVRLAAHPLRWRLLTELAGSDHRVRDLVALLGEPQNLISYHLRLLREGGLVTARRSSFDGRDSYYRLDVDRCGAALAATGTALHPALRFRTAPQAPPARRRFTVLFVCTGNTARSPIAEALLRHHSGGRVTVTSAGTRPGTAPHPDAVRILRTQFGIDADHRPRHVETVAGRRFTHVITLCDKAREACPGFRDTPRRAHWSTREPGADHTFQDTAADLDTRVRHLLPSLEEGLP
jgi:ArsR family transcriptional regulator, arsenate/arsenite/antimonite-responsive transcriptional repressor / arsenate reductase (thioredoxin)